MISNNSKYYLIKRRNGYYYVLIIYRDEINKRHQKYITTHAKLKTDANKFLSNLKANQQIQSEANKVYYKLSDLKKIVLNYIKVNRSKGSFDKYELTFRYLTDILKDKHIDLINYSDIEIFKFELLKKGIRETTINSYIRTLKAIFNHSLKLGIINENKIKFINQFQTSETKILSFTKEELHLIEDNVDKDFKNMIRISYLTGVRISEMINLQIKDIADGVINISNKINFVLKSRKNRVIPINNEIQEVLNDILGNSATNVIEMYNPEDYLFSKFGLRLDRKNISNKFKCLIKKLKLNPQYHWHCLRATFIMSMVRKNINPLIIKELAGHSSLSVTEKYCKVHINDLKKAMNV